MSQPTLDELKHELRRFTAERGWQAFHSPKNLAMALGGEAGELLEQFQWLGEEESAAPGPEKREAIEHEIADVLIYLVMLADKLDVDLLDAALAKLAINEAKYPAEEASGTPERIVERKNAKG